MAQVLQAVAAKKASADKQFKAKASDYALSARPAGKTSTNHLACTCFWQQNDFLHLDTDIRYVHL